MKILSYFFIIFLVIVGITFAILNASPVLFNYYVGEKSISLSLLLVICFGAGALSAFLLNSIIIFRQRYRISRLAKYLTRLEGELLKHRDNKSESE